MNPEDDFLLGPMGAYAGPRTAGDVAYGAGATGLLFAPGAGVTDLMGYAPDPFQPGEYLPSFGANIREGNYLDAALQTLGGAGDVMMAGGAVFPPLVGVGAAMKAPRAARVASRAEDVSLSGLLEQKYPDVDVSISEASDGISVNKVVVPEGQRSQGVGTSVMNDIIAYADRTGQPIGLTPDTAFGGASKARLTDFYKRFGFVPNKGRNKDFAFRETMVRQPSLLEEPVAPASIRAYHGSPHDFAPAVRVLDTETGKTYVQEAGDPILTGLMAQNPGKYEIIEENPLGMFDLSKMGTGEGAQAYGEGAYLSGSEGIARGYRDALSRGRSSILYKGEPVKGRNDDLTDKEYILDSIATEMGNFDQKPENVIATKIRSLKAQIEEPSGAEVRLAESDEELKELQSLIRASAQRDLEIYQSLDPKDFARGRMYEAEIRVGPEGLLDYDEFLYDQTPDIKKKIKDLVENELTEMDAVNLGYDTGKNVDLKAAKEFMLRDDMTIDEFLGNWQALRGSSDAGEFLLNKYGIPGLKYKAGGSRAPGMDEADIDRNYVIFDESLINILRKYGLLAPLVGGGTAAAVMGADEPQPAGGIL